MIFSSTSSNVSGGSIRASYSGFCAACEAQMDDGSDTETEDLETLLQLRPTTLSGCAAVPRYIDEYADEADMVTTLGEFVNLDRQNNFLTLIAEAIEGLVVQS